MLRMWVMALTLLGGIFAGPILSSAAADEFNVKAEIKAALDAIEEVHGNMGGMGGLGVMTEEDVQAIQGLLGEAEKLVREARRKAQESESPAPQDAAWIVGYARAGRAMAEAANEYRVNQGYQ